MECRTYRKDIVSWSKFGWTSSDSGASLPLAFYFTGLHEQDRVCDFCPCSSVIPTEPSEEYLIPFDTQQYVCENTFQYLCDPLCANLCSILVSDYGWLALFVSPGVLEMHPTARCQLSSFAQTSWMCKKCT